MLETDELGRFKLKNMKIYEVEEDGGFKLIIADPIYFDDDGKLKEGVK